MPGFDQTGPQGAGPLTGRGFGPCGKGVGRPQNSRHLQFQPEVDYFKPRGIPLNQLEEVELYADEVEAIKLHDVDNLEQVVAAQQMGISQPTFARILNRAYKKIGHAIIRGKAIRIKSK